MRVDQYVPSLFGLVAPVGPTVRESMPRHVKGPVSPHLLRSPQASP